MVSIFLLEMHLKIKAITFFLTQHAILDKGTPNHKL